MTAEHPIEPPDVPSPIDLRDSRDAREWERTAQDRPGRIEIFAAFGRELLALGKADMRVLELGSGGSEANPESRWRLPAERPLRG